MRYLMAAFGVLVFMAMPAEAARSHAPGVTQFCGDRVCGFSLPAWQASRVKHRKVHAKHRASNRVAKISALRKPGKINIARRGAGCRSGIGSLSCVVPPLAAKAREIVKACGSTVVSAVAGRPNRSDHPIGRAVDLAGNPRCIYAHLKGWPGGYSTDYGRVGHVHISYNPGRQEWGMRFAHGGGRHHHRAAPAAYATALPHAAW